MAQVLISAGASVLVGVLALIGVVLTNSHSNNKMQNEMKISQAVTATRLEELTREVQLHNNFAQRIPTLEQQQCTNERRLKNLESAAASIPHLETSVDDILRRVKDLEAYHKN